MLVLTTTLTINKTQGARNESFSAEVKRVGAYSSAKEGLGVFTGKVGLALYNDQNKRVKIFNLIVIIFHGPLFLPHLILK